MPEKTLNDLPRELRMLHTKASEALQRDNFDYAIELFMQILEKEPANYDCRKSLRAAQNGKSGGKGGGFFKRALSSAGSSPMVAKGQMAMRKNPLEAIHIAEQILNGDAQSTGAHKLIAEAALAADLPRTAVMSCEILFEKSPKDKEVGMKYAEALALAGEKTKAENVYESLRREYPNDNEIFMALKNLSARKTMDEGGYGALATGQGSYRDILKDKGQTVRLEQENRQVKAQDSTAELIQDYETRLKADPNNLKLLRNLAEVYAQRNEFDRSLTYYDRLSAIDGGNDSALQGQIAGLKVKRFNYALSKLDPNAADYAERAAAINAERQNFQLEECKGRAERYPTDLQIRFELGVLYFDSGKISEAIQEFQKSYNNPHRKMQSISYLAKCFAARGMNELAARKLQEALKEKLSFDDEKKELTYMLGSIYEKMDKKAEAMEQFMAIYEVDIGYKDVEKKVNEHYAS